MATYVLVHGAWHTGELLEPVADFIRAKGHQVYCPTVAGNRPGDDRSKIGLKVAINSIVDYLVKNSLSDVILLGHSYGGMVITGVADSVPERIRRLVYWNAFVPNPWQCLNDLVPPHYVSLFTHAASLSPDHTVVLPYLIWREAFMNDADAELAKKAYDQLNPHPFATFSDPIILSKTPAEMTMPKSYLNCTEDTALPQSHGWHPRMSEKLGMFRLVQIAGSHELCFTNPAALAEGIMLAGRD